MTTESLPVVALRCAVRPAFPEGTRYCMAHDWHFREGGSCPGEPSPRRAPVSVELMAPARVDAEPWRARRSPSRAAWDPSRRPPPL
ncbi:MAG TPA: hypothetical protein VNZ52_13375 [Candidatus Thermoplasmatota archaeon]|nr:hypothetical protein [Candidatus Thermoplasmatota archaeon]